MISGTPGGGDTEVASADNFYVFANWRSGTRTFESMARDGSHAANADGCGQPERLEGQRWSALTLKHWSGAGDRTRFLAADALRTGPRVWI